MAEAGDLFATELSLAGPVSLEPAPAAEEWRYEIETVAKSERGLDRTRQGEVVTLPVARLGWETAAAGLGAWRSAAPGPRA